jgi:hypothetical protein
MELKKLALILEKADTKNNSKTKLKKINIIYKLYYTWF